MIPWIDDPQAAFDAWEAEKAAGGAAQGADGVAGTTALEPASQKAQDLAKAPTAAALVDKSASDIQAKLEALLASSAPTLTKVQIRQIVASLLTAMR